MRVHLALLCALALAPRPAAAQPEDPYGPPPGPSRIRFDLDQVQAVLAVQQLDGWLLCDQGGRNSIAVDLVNPDGKLNRRWFFLIPARGQPVALVHRADMPAFAAVPARKVEYTGHRDLTDGLRAMVKGHRKVAMEYAPRSSIPSLTRVDAATVDLVRKQRVTIESSAQLVQLTKSLWGPAGRIAHHVAIHHLGKLRDDALDHIARKVRAGEKVTEHDVQQRIVQGMRVRGLVGPPPVVAVNDHAADTGFQPTPDRSREIRKGDLVLLHLAGAQEDAPRPIYGEMTWMAYVGDAVPDRFAQAFAQVAAARDAALALITERVGRRRAIKGYEADQAARQVLGKAGFGDKFIHSTGHSLDTSLQGDGANLDDFETKDTRLLVQGAGFTIAPGIYVKEDFGIRAEVNVHIGRGAVEVTYPAQQSITALLAPAR